MSGYIVLQLKQQMGQKPKADKHFQLFLKIFSKSERFKIENQLLLSLGCVIMIRLNIGVRFTKPLVCGTDYLVMMLLMFKSTWQLSLLNTSYDVMTCHQGSRQWEGARCETDLFLWMMALKARPSLHDWVKSWTWTPGYLWVVFWAHLSSASLAVRSSWPTTISEIWKENTALVIGSHFLSLDCSE